MAMLTKVIDIHGKNYPEQFYQMCMSLKHSDNTDWSVPPYEDWTPSQCKWDETQLSTTSSNALVNSKEEGEDIQVGVLDAWPSPPPSPIHGSSMCPPNIELSRENPGKPWIFNTIGSPDFFCILIPDPAMLCQQILAPWIKYNLEDKAQPEIAGTFGKNYPIIIQSLCPTPVNYLCPVLTPSQLQILDTKQPCGEVINWILVKHCPKDLLAGVHLLPLPRGTICHPAPDQCTPRAYLGTNTAIDCYISRAITLGLPILACTPTCICTPDTFPIPYADQIKSLHDHLCMLIRSTEP